ncbi:MAG TPA: type II secretion system protein [Phycisphaerae bacterium]|nr:type II secretion system protein [Phycisphaerae bacterium]
MVRRKNAFTLPELMVVIMVIALVAAIILPYFNRVFSVQRRITCANNLEKLGQAYSMQCAARRMKKMAGTGLGTREWQQELLSRVSGSVEVFHCPEDDGSILGRKASLASYWMDVYPGGTYRGSVCLDEEEGDFVWKLSETQWNTFRAMAAKNGRQSHGYNHPGYIPDSNPDRYYFAFEDMKWSGSPDRDFYDLNFIVDMNGMDITLTITNGVTGYDQYLYLGAPGEPDRKKLFPGPLKNFNGQSVTVKGESASNYGMNSMAGTIEGGRGGKITIMDYELLLVAASPYDETSGDRAEQLTQRWCPDPNTSSGVPRFARHLGKANALFGDGTVKLVTAGLEQKDTVHPEIPKACERYWNP